MFKAIIMKDFKQRLIFAAWVIVINNYFQQKAVITFLVKSYIKTKI